MTIIEINWSNALVITGLGLLIVFTVLILLVGVLKLFSAIFREKEKKTAGPVSLRPDSSNSKELLEQERAAIALALYLYQLDVHDQESGLLTIRHTSHSAWNLRLPGAGI